MTSFFTVSGRIFQRGRETLLNLAARWGTKAQQNCKPGFAGDLEVGMEIIREEGAMPKPFRTTVTGSYPRPVQPADTLKKPSLSRQEADEMIRWAARDQVDAGLDVITDGEVRRENMYYFVQKRVDGLSFDQMQYRTYGKAGFGIEIAAVVDRIANPRLELAQDWKVAREVAPSQVEVKITCVGPHMLAKFSNNQRTDLYPTDRDLALAYAQVLNQEMHEVVRAGCEFIQFDEPAWTAFPEEAEWGVEALNRAVEGLRVKIGLYVCGGNARRYIYDPYAYNSATNSRTPFSTPCHSLQSDRLSGGVLLRELSRSFAGRTSSLTA
jgi:methionine synthase II (cobalamin-independent)